jgi:hypothetical protein
VETLSTLPSEIMREGNVQKKGTGAAKMCEYELEESKGMTHGPGRDLRTGWISLEHVARTDELSHSPWRSGYKLPKSIDSRIIRRNRTRYHVEGLPGDVLGGMTARP